MNIVYQIKANGVLAYALNIVKCDEICAKLINEGIYPKVRRMKKSDVPMSDLSMVLALK